VGVSLALPDPPLTDPDAGVRLRSWSASPADAVALAAAWADPAIAAANVVPADVSAASAARWLAGDTARRSAGRNLDLVVAPIDGGPEVLGEVGLRNLDGRRRRAELSWWICPEHRRRRLATAATRLLADWALADDGGDLVQVWARVDRANVASAKVAAAAGLVPLGAAGGADVWARSRVTTPSG
jgi:RimJ/RimL family protein N-acetyltransferase